jgi:ferritin-like metal-binding protein YciE
MIAKAKNPQLKKAFESHLKETEGQVERLDQAFKLLGKAPKGAACPAIDGIIKEANEIAGEIADQEVLDAALLASAQAVEHYEITRYGTLMAWGTRLGYGDLNKLFQQNLDQEKNADEKLTGIATRSVNKQAP